MCVVCFCCLFLLFVLFCLCVFCCCLVGFFLFYLFRYGFLAILEIICLIKNVCYLVTESVYVSLMILF